MWLLENHSEAIWGTGNKEVSLKVENSRTHYPTNSCLHYCSFDELSMLLSASIFGVNWKIFFKDLPLISKFPQVAKLFVRSHEDVCLKVIWFQFYDYGHILDGMWSSIWKSMVLKMFVYDKKTMPYRPDNPGKFALIFSQIL